MKEIFKAKLDYLNSNVWGYYFRIPDLIAQQFIDGLNRRIICTLNDSEKIHCGLLPSPEGYYITINNTVRKKLKIELGDQVKLDIEKDTSRYGIPVPEEFEAVILNAQEIAKHFEVLTPGKKRDLIYLVNKIKSSDIRINRSMAIAQHLKETQGKLDFRQLNETIKIFNQRNKIR